MCIYIYCIDDFNKGRNENPDMRANELEKLFKENYYITLYFLEEKDEEGNVKKATENTNGIVNGWKRVVKDRLSNEKDVIFFFHLGQREDDLEKFLGFITGMDREIPADRKIYIFFYSGNLGDTDRQPTIEDCKKQLKTLSNIKYIFCEFAQAKEYAKEIAEALNSSKDINPILKKIFHDHDLNMTNTINSISELNFELLKLDILKKISAGLEKKYSALLELKLSQKKIKNLSQEQKENISQELIKWLYAIDSLHKLRHSIDSLHKLRHSLVNIISPLHYTINDLDSSNSDEKRKAEEEWKELIKDSDSRPSLQKRLLAISKEWDKLAHLLDNTNSSELKKISNDLKRLIEEKLDNPSEFFKELEKLKSVYNNWLHKIESKDGNE